MTSSSTMTVTTLTITLVLKLASSLERSFLMSSRFGQIGDAQHEIHFHFAGSRDSDLFDLAGQPFMPRFQFVSAWRHIEDCVAASFVGGGKEGIFQDQHDAVHPRVNGTENVHPPGMLECPALDFWT